MGSEPEKEKWDLCHEVGLHMALPPPPGHHLPPTETMGQEHLTEMPRASHYSGTEGMASGVLEVQDL